MLLISRENGTLDLDVALVGDLARRSGSDGRQVVVERCKATMGGSRQMTRQEVAEGEIVGAVTQGRGVRQELPLVDLRGLGDAVWAMWRDWLLCGDDGEEAHLELLDCDIWLMDVDHKLSREDGASRRLRCVEEDNWGRLDAHVHGNGSLGLSLGALLVIVMVLLMLVTVEDIHDERFLRPCLLLGRGLVGVDRGEEGLGVWFGSV